MRCTNRRSSRTLKNSGFDGSLGARDASAAAADAGTVVFSTLRMRFLANLRIAQTLFFQQKYTEEEEMTTTTTMKKREKNAQADSMLFIVLFTFCSVLLSIAVVVAVAVSVSVVVLFVCVVFRVFVRNIFRLILSRMLRQGVVTAIELFFSCSLSLPLWLCVCFVFVESKYAYFYVV